MEGYMLIKETPVGGNAFSLNKKHKIIGVYADYPTAYNAKIYESRNACVMDKSNYYIETTQIKGGFANTYERIIDYESYGWLVEVTVNVENLRFHTRLVNWMDKRQPIDLPESYRNYLSAMNAGLDYLDMLSEEEQ